MILTPPYIPGIHGVGVWSSDFRPEIASLSSSPSPSQNLPIPFSISHSYTVQWRNRRKPPLSFPNHFSFLISLLVIIIWFVWTEADMRERLSLNLQLFYLLIFFLCEYLLFGLFCSSPFHVFFRFCCCLPHLGCRKNVKFQLGCGFLGKFGVFL